MAFGRIVIALLKSGLAPLLLVSLAAWSLLICSGAMPALSSFCTASAGYDFKEGWRALEAFFYLNRPGSVALPWVLMVLAMTPPLLADHMTHLWDRSLARRRWRAVVLFNAAHLALWSGAGVVLVAMAIALRAGVGVAAGIPLGLAAVAAVLWQLTPARRACVDRCHRHPRLSAFGWAADRDCLGYGLAVGLWCVGSCWALMLLALVADHGHALVMAVASIFLLSERFWPAPQIVRRSGVGSLSKLFSQGRWLGAGGRHIIPGGRVRAIIAVGAGDRGRSWLT